MSGFRRYGLAFVAGAAAALAMPPLDLWPALFIAFPVFLVLLESSKGSGD